MGVKESLEYHESKLELQVAPESMQLANAIINPKYRTIQHWHEKWRLTNLGRRHGTGVLDVNTKFRFSLYIFISNAIVLENKEEA